MSIITRRDVRSMTSKFVAQGFTAIRLKDKFMEFCARYINKWAKFDVIMSSGVIIKSIF